VEELEGQACGVCVFVWRLLFPNRRHAKRALSVIALRFSIYLSIYLLLSFAFLPFLSLISNSISFAG
jgi:hypothetical protein